VDRPLTWYVQKTYATVDTMKKGGIEATRGRSYSPILVPDFPTPFSRESRFLRLSRWVSGTWYKPKKHREQTFAPSEGAGGVGPACGDVGTITNGGNKELAPAATTTEYVGTADGVCGTYDGRD